MSKLPLFLSTIIMVIFAGYSAYAQVDEQKAEDVLQPLIDEFQVTADKGDMESQYQLGMILSMPPYEDDKSSIPLIKQSADQGHCIANANYGLMLQVGWESLKKDKKGAYDYFLKGAEAGCLRSQTMLGHAYREGNGVKKNLEQAMIWYEKAANAGEQIAAYQMGEAYRKGKGVKKNLSEALYWYMVSFDGEVEGRAKQRIEQMLKITKRKMKDEEIGIVVARIALRNEAQLAQWSNYIDQ